MLASKCTRAVLNQSKMQISNKSKFNIGKNFRFIEAIISLSLVAKSLEAGVA